MQWKFPIFYQIELNRETTHILSRMESGGTRFKDTYLSIRRFTSLPIKIFRRPRHAYHIRYLAGTWSRYHLHVEIPEFLSISSHVSLYSK